MEIEQIPADELVVMTDFFHRAFNAAGCNPMCHCCRKMIPVGDNFKLSTVLKCKMGWGYAAYFQKQVLLGNKTPTIKDYLAFTGGRIRPEFKESDTKNAKEDAESYKPQSREVMLCDTCSPDSYMAKEIEELNKEIKRLEAPKGGCFRVGGKIVI